MQREKIEDLVSRMTLKEKLELIHGRGLFETGKVERLKIPALKMSDGPMGVRREFKQDAWEGAYETEDYVTYLPSNVALASTFNTDLAYEAGYILGKEARGRGKDVILAPGINIMRSPLCGRNFEYMSEDPYLISKLTVPFIKGVQENDVAACVKHFALNNQETERMKVDVVADERTLREIYFPGFEAAIKEANSYTIMSAYNQYRGEYCSHSTYLLDTVLREEWGYDGVVISDWGAVHDTEKAAMCSLDIEMDVKNNFDDYYLASPLLKAVQSGRIKESYIDEKVKRILKLMFKLNKLEGERQGGTYAQASHREKALAVAKEAVVLLKNESILPFNAQTIKKVAVIGENAQVVHAAGGGSAEIKALYETSPILGLKMELGGNVQVAYEKGYTSEEEKPEVQKSLFERALELAREADTVIFIGGLNHKIDVEGQDKQDIALPYRQDDLIEALLQVAPDMIITIIAGSPVAMPWKDKAKAIVYTSYAGVESGLALAKVLLGKVNPSGKLPVTFPSKLEDSPAHSIGEFPGNTQVYYKENIFVGYRYFDSYGVEPAFCFGHGLSYTNFKYDYLAIHKKEEGILQVEVEVKNTGKVAGAEVVQLYIQDVHCLVPRPQKELKGFAKVYLEPGESKKVSLELTEKDFTFYSVQDKAWKCEVGEYKILVGSSSRDIRLAEVVQFQKERLFYI
jgi:beta-glucosidase